MTVKNKTVKKKLKKKLKNNNISNKLQSKVDELNLEIEELKKEIENYKDKNVRLLAEFDNFKKRSVNERKKLTKYAGESFIKCLIPIIDDLSRTIDSTDEESPLLDGIKLVKSKMEKLLEDYGVKSFESVGNSFDPELHEALMSEESENEKEGIVLREFEKGYKYHDKILRHSKVVVSKAKAGSLN